MPPNPQLPKRFQQIILKGKVERGPVYLFQTSWSSNLLFWQCRSGHSISINLQQDNCYFLFCNFLLPYEWKSFTVFKVESGRQSLENGLSCTFQAPGNILLQWCGANMTEHRQQSTKVALKGIDPAQRQPCFLC